MNLQRSLVLLGALFFAGLGSAWAATHAVTVSSDTFSPSSLTINVGDTVTFTNAGGFHNIHSTSGPTSFHCSVDCTSHNAPDSSAWHDTVTFPTAGTINYQCDEHATMGMVGSIIVNAVTPPPPTILLGGYLSGNWFIPSQGGGQGFQLEFTNNANDMIAIWFVYTPAGSTANDGSGQNWIYAEGPFDPTKSTVILPAILLAGASFPPNFHAADVHRVPNDASTWGTITFSFSDCNNGSVSWHSTLIASAADYTKANDTPMAIQRLTQIAGTTCPQ